MPARRLFALLGILALVAVACAPAATPTPTRAPTPTPIRVVATPTPTPVPPPTPTPTLAGPKYGGTLNLASDIKTNVWDTIATTDSRAHHAVDFMYNRLAQRNPGPPSCSLVPLHMTIAESWEWLNPTTLEVKIRQGVRFQNRPPVNGREITADDVLFSLLTLGKKVGLGISDVPKVVERGEAVDKHTLRLYLKVPNSGLPWRISHDRANMYAPEAVGEDLAIELPEEHVGTGPFMLKSQRPGVNVVLERNPDYWEEGLPYLDEINLRIVPDASTRAALFRSGELDLIFRQPISVSIPLAKMPDVQVQKCPTLPTYPLGLRSDKPPFDDVRVRRAVSMAIDRQAIIDTVYLGEATPVYSPIPYMKHPSFMKLEDYPPEVRKYLEYHPEESQKLLAEAGYPNGFKTAYNYRTDYPYDGQVGEAISAMLAQVGITVELSPIEPGGWGKKRREGIDGITALIVGPEPPQYPMNRHYHGTTAVSPYWSLVGFKSAELDSLIETGLADTTQMDRVLKEIQTLMAKELFNVPMPARHEFFISRPYVKNVSFKVFYLYNISEFLYRAWLDK